MSWFGWLTKGRFDVSLLDRLTMWGEAVALISLFVCACLVWSRVKARFR